jgi:hypothetical protein
MKNYKEFLNENRLIVEAKSNAYNIAINDESDLDKVKLKPDIEIVRGLLSLIKGYGFSDIPLVANSNGALKIRAKNLEEEISKWFADNGYDKTNIVFGMGSIGKEGDKISTSTQELMVASLVLIGKTYHKKLTIEEANDIIKQAKESFSTIIGVSGQDKLLDQYDKNYNDLATAISSSNSILGLTTPKNVFWTGQKWDKRIAKYNPAVANIKDYNSSDIVVEGNDGKFLGISLKKKSKTKDVDPTLINKPITGAKSVLKDVLDDTFIQQVEDQKEIFFDNTIKKHYKTKDLELSKLSEIEKKKMISNISQKQMGKYLKSKDNNFFKFIGENLPKYTEKFTSKFLELLFRTDLGDMLNADEFTFYLSTGIGRFNGKEVIVEESETKDLNSIIEVLTKLFNSDLRMNKTKGKLNAWEDGTNAAKIFFTISSDGKPIINIEIRYKGSYTANPQFQAVATPNFKTLFKK